jgi:ribosomal-protein-alanine N-acetyltransferase
MNTHSPDTLELLTPRLAIRIPDERDLDAYRDALCAPTPHPTIWDRPALESLTRDEALTSRADKLRLADEGRAYFLSIFDRRQGFYIGDINLMEITRSNSQNVVLGYYIHHSRRRLGYASEACHAAISFAFDQLKLHRIEAGIEPENEPSIQLIQHLGFRREGLARRRIFERDDWRDLTLWALTIEDFFKIHNIS